MRKEKFDLSPSIGLSFILLFDGSNNRNSIYSEPGYYVGDFEVVPEEIGPKLSFNAGLNFSYKINKDYEIKPVVMYEFIKDIDDGVKGISSNNNVFYFMIGLNKTLKNKNNK